MGPMLAKVEVEVVLARKKVWLRVEGTCCLRIDRMLCKCRLVIVRRASFWYTV